MRGEKGSKDGALMKRRRQIMRTAALGAVLLLGFADAGARTETVWPYEIAGPDGLGSDQPVCLRLADALNAEGSRDFMVCR